MGDCKKELRKGVEKVGETVGKTRVKTRVKTREKILALINENPQITQEELSAKTGITIKGIEWNLKKLKQNGILKRVGPAKGGHWEIVRKN